MQRLLRQQHLDPMFARRLLAKHVVEADASAECPATLRCHDRFDVRRKAVDAHVTLD
jgi:hypothetical protein